MACLVKTYGVWWITVRFNDCFLHCLVVYNCSAVAFKFCIVATFFKFSDYFDDCSVGLFADEDIIIISFGI